mgnify:CR=1 FL=1
MNGLERDFEGRAAVLQLDANEADNAQLQQQYRMRGHPTFVVLDEDGRAVQTFIGAQPKAILYEALTAVAASTN